MDKVTLTKEQLKVLVRFIHSRGFREPSVVMDILDHFACKVEERIQAKPDISFEQAIHDAHRSFGVTGFRNLVVAHQAQFEMRQKRVFRKNAIGLLTNIPFVLGLIVLAIAFYQGYVWAQVNSVDVLWGTNVFSLGIFLVSVAGAAKIHGVLPKKYLKNTMETGYPTSAWAWIGHAVFFTSIQYAPGLTDAKQMPAAYCTFVIVYLVIYYVAEYKTIKKLFENYKDVEHMLLELEQ